MPIDAPITGTTTATQFNPAQIASAVQTPITTSSEQLRGILDANGPLMQQAATTGNQQAAKRGLLNSSMGIQSAQSAIVGAAGQLAQNDATAINQGNQFNTSAANDINKVNAGYNQDAAKTNATNDTSINQWNVGQQNESILKTMDVNSREQLAGIEANYKNLMQTNQGATDMYSQVMKNINEIQLNKDVTDKATAIDSQLAWLRSGLTMVQNLGGVSGLVTF